MRHLPILVGLALIVAGCGSDEPGSVVTTVDVAPPTIEPLPTVATAQTMPAPSEPLMGLSLTLIADGFADPAAMSSPPDDDRLFVVELFGTIRLATDGRASSQASLDLTNDLATGGNRGLTGLAFHPDFAFNGRVFVMHNDASGNTRIVEYAMRADDPDRFDEKPVRLILEIDQSGFYHQGGTLDFGPDGYLWVTLGDGGAFAGEEEVADPFGNGQDPHTLQGAVLRLDVDSGSPYAIPPDNPFADGSEGAPEVWAYGLRNPWRVAIDPLTGLVFVSDVGQWAWEEINITTLDQSGRNYGWPILEGDFCRDADTCEDVGLTRPGVTYDHSEGCAVIGGPVYRGAAIPELQGAYFYGDFCFGWIRSLRFESGAIVSEQDWTDDLGGLSNITSFAVDASGEMYVLQQTGEIYRIDPIF